MIVTKRRFRTPSRRVITQNTEEFNPTTSEAYDLAQFLASPLGVLVPEDEGSASLRNVRSSPPNDMASHSKVLDSSVLPNL